MLDSFVEGPTLWFLNRSTGFVILGLLTLSVLLGIASTVGREGGRVANRFAAQSLHRNIALLSTLMLVIHVATAVIDSFVDIRWWQAFSPFGATYEPLWMAFGAISLDLILLVILTSAIRSRMKHRPWRIIHLSSYAAWALGVVHGLGIGTDMTGVDSRGVWFTLACVASVLILGGARLLGWKRHRAGLEQPYEQRSPA